jgi:hypothetical protein
VDIIITTALIPGKPAPKLITAEMVRSMKPGSVIVDMAAEQGGNCELTEPGKAVVKHGVTIVGYTDLASRMARQSSTLYGTNLFRLTEELCKTKDGVINVNMQDDAIRGLTVIKDGEITWPRRPSPPRPSRRPSRRWPRPRRKVVMAMAAAARCRPRPWPSCSVWARWPSGPSAPTRRRPSSALHRVRAGLLHRLHGGLERDAGAAHAADERDQRHLQHHRDRCAGADPAAGGRHQRAT